MDHSEDEWNKWISEVVSISNKMLYDGVEYSADTEDAFLTLAAAQMRANEAWATVDFDPRDRPVFVSGEIDNNFQCIYGCETFADIDSRCDDCNKHFEVKM